MINNILKRVSNKALFLCIVYLVFLKVFFYFLIKSDYLSIGLGGGNDADYYDAFAHGYITNATSIWPVILEKLYKYNLYSREVISYVFLLANIVFIPFLTANLAGVSFNKYQKLFLVVLLIALIYPSLYFFVFDIYRDVVMVLLFLIGSVFVKKYITNKNATSRFINFFLALLVGWCIILFRPYLGVAFLGAMFIWRIKFTKKRLIFLFVLYLLTLFTANILGLFNSLTEYREGFEGASGSTLGLDFSNPIMFLPNFVLSILGQMFGLFITNPFALLVFVIETIPFLIMLKYVIKNVKLADGFVRYLLIFFVIYGSVWLIGNDNLGTAVRLRMYNYFAIYISFFYILNLKRQQGIK